jgi:hypothetical protein
MIALAGLATEMGVLMMLYLDLSCQHPTPDRGLILK